MTWLFWMFDCWPLIAAGILGLFLFIILTLKD